MKRKRRSLWSDPVRIVPMAFLGTLAAFTFLLMLPLSNAQGHWTPFLVALFTATSALCITGLSVVDTSSYWTGFGQAVILLTIQIGGLGIMTGATMIAVMLGRHMGIDAKLVTRTERGSINLWDSKGLLFLIFLIAVGMEVAVALLLAARWHFGYGIGWLESLWHGLFHAVSAFNNAGFSTFKNNLADYNADWWVLLPIMIAITIGALGFPVLNEIRVRRRWRGNWSLHSKMTVTGSLILFLFGFIATAWAEWTNPGTLGPMPWHQKLLNSAFQAVTLRTAGFNSFDIGSLRHESIAIEYLIMFVGGGSAGTSGGVKVTTFMILGLMAVAFVQKRPDATIFGRRIPSRVQKEAVAFTLISFAMVFIATLILVGTSSFSLERVAYEAASAFGTVGLTTGITPDLPPIGQVTLIVLMFVGRVGTITVAAALISSGERIRYRYPEEEPLVG